ncbi:hypothetical protein JHK86_043035 [Glycine max]|nr:hypothetical protein JHK86_043035 [Glycine max]
MAKKGYAQVVSEMQTVVMNLPNPTIAFTTPPNYIARLSHFLTLNSYTHIWCLTLLIQSTPSALTSFLSPHSLHTFSAIAFTSCTTIQSFLQASLPDAGS